MSWQSKQGAPLRSALSDEYLDKTNVAVDLDAVWAGSVENFNLSSWVHLVVLIEIISICQSALHQSAAVSSSAQISPERRK